MVRILKDYKTFADEVERLFGYRPSVKDYEIALEQYKKAKEKRNNGLMEKKTHD